MGGLIANRRASGPADEMAAPPRRFAATYLTMTATDSFGSGLFKTLAVLFWSRYAHLGLPTVGLGLTVGGLVAMAALLPLGRLGDRVGHRRMVIALNLVVGTVVAGFPLVREPAVFFAVVAVASAAEAALGPLRRSYVGRQLSPPVRRRFNARNRATFNAGFGCGAALAGIGLAAGSNRILVVLVLGNAASFLLAAAAMYLLPPDRAPDQPAGGAADLRGVLGHPRLIGSGALVGLLALSEEALEVGVPVWIATTSRVPVAMISVALVVNTVFVVLFQVPLARRLESLPTLRSFRLAGCLLLLAFALMAPAWLLPQAAAIAVLLVFVLLLSTSEVIAATVDWDISYRTARAGRESESQAAFSLGTNSHRAVGGVLFAGALAAGPAGWLVAGAAPALVLAATAFRGVRRLTGPGEPPADPGVEGAPS